jgi:hypothetical protein
MKRITADGLRRRRGEKLFGLLRAIRAIEHVPSAKGHPRSPLSRISSVERIESFISVECESDDLKTEIAVKTIRERL